tara:strand:+ start:4922 stop:5146 length:225 start_codon:yes stop_codon:yes gene_type:complete
MKCGHTRRKNLSEKEKIACDDCGNGFEVRWDDSQEKLAYCPFCGADLFWNEEDDDEEEDNNPWSWEDPDNDEYS